MPDTFHRSARQFVKFSLVGASGVVVNLLVFVSVLVVAGLVTGQPLSVANLVSREVGRLSRTADLIANASGFGVSVVSNYLLNRRWTFRSTNAVPGEMARFVLVSLVAYAGQVTVFWICITHLHLGRTPSQLAAIACVMPINFVANKLWSFR
jgi:putative flippase GtrA